MTRARSDPFPAFASSFLLAGFGLFWFSHTVADPDLWGHIRFGQDILRTGSIVQEDIYSYRTGGQPWINHEWLSEVIFAGLYDLSGPAGLIAFKVLAGLLILGLCYGHLRRGGLGPFRSVLLLLLISIPFRMGLGTIRPQIFTYCLFLSLLLLIEGAATRRQRWLWASPLLFAAWANLHGGVLAGAGALGLWGVARLVERPGGDAGHPGRRLGAVVRVGLLGVACGLALLLNPYRAGLVLFLLRTATVPRPEISEWTPLALTSLPGQVYLGLLAIGIVGLVGSRRHRAPAAALIFGAMAVLTLMSNRHYPLFALALVVLAGEHVADVGNRWWPPAPPRSNRARGAAAVSLLVALPLIALSPARFDCIRIEPYYFPFPTRAVAFLWQSGVRGNMAVPFAWGEYVLWHLGPGVKVSVDGRRETAYSDESYRQSLDFERGTGAWDALLKAPPTDLVLAPNWSPTANLLGRTEGWVPLYRDTFCVLFIRAGRPDLDRFLEHPLPDLPDNGEGLCFPGPSRGQRGATRPSP
jgi:hypothetical protein